MGCRVLVGLDTGDCLGMELHKPHKTRDYGGTSGMGPGPGINFGWRKHNTIGLQ